MLQRKSAGGAEQRRGRLMALRAVVLVMVVWGSLQAVSTVLNAADASMGLMATINLVAVIALSGVAIRLTRDYFAQRAAGREPEFESARFSAFKGVDRSIWK